jgi:hypothetical protein
LASPLIKATTLLFFVQLGNITYNDKRKSANHWVANLYSNNKFTASKENFI